jgi:hypothetical protein
MLARGVGGDGVVQIVAACVQPSGEVTDAHAFGPESIERVSPLLGGGLAGSGGINVGED